MNNQGNCENKMGTMPEGRLLMTMALPIMISMLVQAFYNIVDSYFVSLLSENAFNAVGLAFPIQALMIAVGAGTGVGMNALLSRSLGEGKQEMADRAANSGIFLALISGLAFALLGLLGSKAFFEVQAASVPEIVAMGTTYTSIVTLCSGAMFVQFCIERLLQATGRATRSMATQLLGAVLNIVLDPILIFGLFGLPALGVAGAAWATVIGQALSALLGLWMNLFRNPEIHLDRRCFRYDGPVIRETYRVGLPSIIMQSITSVMTFGLNHILFAFTPTATAVFGAYFKIQSFVFMPIFGMNNGLVPIISYNYGACKPKRVRKTIRLALLAALTVLTAGMLLFQLFPGELISIFNASEEMMRLGIPAMRIISLGFPLAAFGIIACSVCQAIGNPNHAMIASVCRQLVVLLPVAWLLAQSGQLSLVWWCFPIAEVVSFVMCIFFYRSALAKMKAKIGE